LLPYTSRVTTQRGRPRRDDDGERRPRRDREESSEEFAEISTPDSGDVVDVVDDVVSEEVEA
jgi:hypothetical protein